MADDPLVFSADEDFTASRLNKAMQVVNLRLKATEAVRADFDAAVATLKEVGLARINDALLPAYQELAGLIQLGVLFTTTSASPVVLGAGARTFLIAEADRERFGAAAYLGAQKTGDPTIRLSGALQSYDRASGLLVIAVDQVVGPAGATVAAWTISAAAPPDYATTAHAVGAYTQAETDAVIEVLAAGLLGGVAPAGNTLAKLYGLIGTNTAALSAITGGDDPALDSFAEVLTRFLAEEGNIAAVMTALANRVRVDAAQSLTPAQMAQGVANLGITNNLSPAGQVGFFAMSSAPAGWLKANGAAVSRTTYATLFAAINTTFGAGDGSTTFNLPDLRGEFLRALDDSRGVDASRALGSAQTQNLPNFRLRLPIGWDASSIFGWSDANFQPIFGNEVVANAARVTVACTTSTNSVRVGYTDAAPLGVSGELRPRNVALLACIKY